MCDESARYENFIQMTKCPVVHGVETQALDFHGCSGIRVLVSDILVVLAEPL